MEKMFNEWVDKSCDRALVECKEYIEKEYNGECDETELRILADRAIYKKGVKDCLGILKLLELI